MNYHFCEGVSILSLYAFKGENVFFKCGIVVQIQYNEAFNKGNWQASVQSVGVLIIIP